MAYGGAKHTIWTERCKNYAGATLALWEEGQRLHEIYVNEANSGADAAFVANSLATKAEFQAMMTLAEAMNLFVNSGTVPDLDRMTVLTPLTQNP